MPERVDAFTKCAQVITLRTQLNPQAFTGTPTVNINSGQALRTIQWGSNVFAAANFSVSVNQNVNLPSGTWYDYLNGAQRANSAYTLAPGELKVFTSTALQAHTFEDIMSRPAQGIEDSSAAVPVTAVPAGAKAAPTPLRSDWGNYSSTSLSPTNGTQQISKSRMTV